MRLVSKFSQEKSTNRIFAKADCSTSGYRGDWPTPGKNISRKLQHAMLNAVSSYRIFLHQTLVSCKLERKESNGRIPSAMTTSLASCITAFRDSPRPNKVPCR